MKNIKTKIIEIFFSCGQKGMSALLVVVIIGTTSLVMAKGAAFLSMGRLEMSQLMNQGNSAFYLAEACLNEALLFLNKNNDFVTTGHELLIDDDSCFFTVTAEGNERVIRAVGMKDGYTKSLGATVIISSTDLILNSFELIED